MSDHDESPSAPEEAVRSYLLFLDDPSQLRDEAEVQRRTVAVLEAQDPIEKLKALAALEKASTVDEKGLRAAFVEYARRWAQENGISVDAFRKLNVPDDVLADAGFDVARPRSRRSTPAAGTDTPRRRPAVSAADIKEAVLTLVEPFTLADVISKVGGSPMTVRKAVDDLIAEGRVEKQGPVPGHSGRGRAPIQYARV